jgi:hypothetical protein
MCCSILLSGETVCADNRLLYIDICINLARKGGAGYDGGHVRVLGTLHQLPGRCG